MSRLDLDKAQSFNAVAWLLNNDILNENGSKIEFKDHAFMIDPYIDEAPRQVAMKCSQIGWSVLAILRSFHLARYAGANIIHTFPSRNMAKDFVVPKVDPLIDKNPIIRKMTGVSSMNLKQIGDRFIYYRGSYEQTEAISISAHILINDEYDRSNQNVLKTYRSRLDDARRENPELGWEWQFSNPSIPGYGVDVNWNKSDQKHWFVRCSRCNHFWYMKWPESINMETQEKICLKCKRPLTKEAIRNGQWVPKYKNREISGYWVSQLFVPWIPASKIIEDSEGDEEIFHNFTLGLPFVSKDTSVTREALLGCISPGANPRSSVSIGVDNGVIKHYVIGNQHGIFEIGTTTDWEKIEQLRNRYHAVMVIDALPYPTTPNILAEKYPGKVFVHYYQQDKKSVGTIRWDQRVAKSDRTKVIDFVVAEINSKDIIYNLTEREMEDYIHHWTQMFRVIEKTPTGIMKPMWRTIEGRPDHFAHATILWRVGLEKTMGFGGIVKSPVPGRREIGHPTTSEDMTVPALNLKAAAQRANRRTRKV